MTNMTDLFLKVNSELTKARSTYYFLLISIVASIIWIVYLTYYNSRVLGLILTLCLNKFQKYGHIHFGSFSISVLSGKIMFRDVYWITEDYSVRLKFGYLIFRWWQPLTKKEYHEDLSHSYTRLTAYLENFEYHVYNCSSHFSKLEKIFGLDDNIIPPSKNGTPTKIPQNVSKVELNKAKWQWRDLIPVIKIDINTSRIIFGNYLMPQSLLLSAREMHLVYTTKPASTPFDLFMHVVKCKTDNFKVMFVPSPKYSGKADEPPRCMGEGFAVMQSNDVEFYYYQDEPGLVPYEPESVYLANGDIVSIRTWPCWGMDVKCGKNTDFSYGPWCERQRKFLWKFFFPLNYQPMQPDVLPNPGQLRTIKNFDFKMSMQNDITIDILFTKEKETQAIHMNCKQGSYVEFTIPMFLEEAGYAFTVTGQLLHVDSSTSIKFRSLLECETLQFSVSAKFLSNWNDLQELTYDFTACKATGHLIYNHITFFTELSEDWADKARPDIYSFIPYTVKVNLLLKDFEIITLTNQCNWIDCFGTSAENSHIALCGDTFDVSIHVPFNDFLPNKVNIKMFIRAESAEVLIYLPETNTNQQVLIGLSENLKILSRDGEIGDSTKTNNDKKWSRVCSRKNGWVEAISSPIVALSLIYKYHPIYPMSKDPTFMTSEDVDSEEALLVPFKLIPLRPLRSQAPQKKKGKTSPSSKYVADDGDDVDLSKMESDLVSLEIEVGPSVAYLYGSLVKNFLNLKENYFGEYQKFSDFEKNIEKVQTTTLTEVSTSSNPVDPRLYRPLNVIFHLTLHEVQGHLAKNCSKEGEPCPCIYFERMVFEMDKRFHETKLQVFFSPLLLVCKDRVKRPSHQSHLENGHLTLSALQIRGHAMFSHQGLPVNSETLEYAWLIEVTIGDLVGRMTSVQLQSVTEFLQTFISLVEDKENELICPQVYPLCQHMLPQNLCQKSGGNQPCTTVADLKYELIRMSVDCVDFYLVESGTALCLQIHPVRLSNCNLFNQKNMMGISILLPKVSLKHYTMTKSGSKPKNDDPVSNIWLETGGFSLGPINVDLSKVITNMALLYAQQEFLRLHDYRYQRLTFLWSSDKCGCLGGCRFFGTNRNGPTFFYPTPDDFIKSYNVAVPYVCRPDNQEMTFGFGQSILRNQQLIFNQPVLSAAEYLSEIFKNSSFAPLPKESRPTNENDNISEITRSFETLDAEESEPSQDFIVSKIPSDNFNKSIEVTSPRPSDAAGSENSGTVPAVDSVGIPRKENARSSESSKVNLNKKEDFRGSHTLTIDFPITLKNKISSKILSIADKVRQPRRLSLSVSSSVHKWQSEKELNQMKAYSPLDYGSLSKERLTSSKSSVYENAVQFVDANECLDGSLDSFVSATSASPDHALQLNSKPVLIKHNQDDTFQEQPRPSEKQFKDAPIDISDKFFPYQRKPPPPSSLNIKSPQPMQRKCLTLDCYKCYLSQMSCRNWTTVAPVSSINRGLRARKLSNDAILNNMVPNFVCHSKGFDSTTKLYKITTDPMYDSESEELKTSFSHYNFGSHFKVEKDQLNTEAITGEKNEFHVNDWIVVIRFKESINAMLSPLMLDSLNEYIEASTPILSQMHPSSIVDMLNVKCLNSVNEQEDKTTSPCLSVSDPSSTSTTIDKLEQEKFHIFIDLPQVNISMLQACVVDDMPIAYSMEKARDLTSVSLFIMCIDSVKIQMLSRAEIKSTSTLLMSNATAPKNKKSSEMQDMHSLLISNLGNKLGVGKKKNPENARLQKMLGHTNTSIIKCKFFSEVKKKSFVMKVDMSRIHFQLRRSRNLSGTPDPLSLTAIPASSSKVFFSFLDGKSTEGEHSKKDELLPYSWNVFGSKINKTAKDKDDPIDSSIDGVIGLLMFECGFENISFSAGGRFGYVKKEAPIEGDFNLNSPSEVNALSSPELQPDDLTIHPGARNASCFCTSRAYPKISKEKGAEASGKHKSETTKAPSQASQPTTNSNKSNTSALPAEDKTDSSLLDARTDLEGSVKENEVKEDILKGDASSFSLEIKTVWLNFAAPPASSKDIKFLSNRHDWNLLSTATPSINAWVNSCHKVTTGAKNMYNEFNKRMSSVMACLMTDALEVQGIHLMAKSKYNKTTWESKFLQDDPSCQLLTVMRKYINLVGADAIEASLAEDTLPQALTIRNGLLVLTRQWKNVLYLPMFDENSFRAKKKVTVTFAVPVIQSNDNNDENVTHNSKYASHIEEIGINLDNLDIIDESTSLLKAEGGSVQRMRSSEDSEIRFQHHGIDLGQFGLQKPVFLETTSPIKKTMANDISNLTLNSGCSSDRVVPLLSNSVEFDQPSSMLFLPGSKSKLEHREDLQQWMNKQQEYLVDRVNAPPTKDLLNQSNIHKQETRAASREGTAASESSKDGSVAMHKVLASPTFQLVDAQVLFKPLLKALGLHLEAVRMSAIMKKFGGELSVLANLKEIRVEIVDSESTIKAKLLKKRPVIKLPLRARPAFLCKHFSVTLSMKDILDIEPVSGNKKNKLDDPGDITTDREPVYLKTVQLYKDTIDQIEAKPATTKINFSVMSQSVTQHVNMPLLRLVHQFVNMVEDVAQTKSDLCKGNNFHQAQPETCKIGLEQKVKSHHSKHPIPEAPKRPNAIHLPQRPLTVDELEELEKTIETPQHNNKDGIPSPFKLFKVNGEPIVIEAMDSASPAVQQKTIIDEIKATTPKCWKNLYHLLNLYNSMPDVMQTFNRSQLSVIDEEVKTQPSKKKRIFSLKSKPMQSNFFTQNIVVRERVPLVVFGTVLIKAINISAVLSGLKLHAELQHCQASLTHGEKIKGIAKKKSTESSASVSVDLTTVTLLESFQPMLQQTVVQMKISRSSGMFSLFLKKSSENSVCLLSIGLITINIPQHPVALHTMVVHSSKRLSNTLQEFIKLPTKNTKSLDTLDTPISGHHASTLLCYANLPHQSYSSTAMSGIFPDVNLSGIFPDPPEQAAPSKVEKKKLKPIIIHFRAQLKGLIVGASLLPSLKSQYQMGEVKSVGVLGTKSKFTIHLLNHSLSFSSKVLGVQSYLWKQIVGNKCVNVPSNIPTSASIALPPIHIQAEYLLQQQASDEGTSSSTLTEGMILREGNYLKATAEVGAFEHVLTTDLLNHLVFVQKVFMKEVNEVVQKVSGSDQPVFLWADTFIAPQEQETRLLYSFLFRLKSLQITATTPTNNAVRLETGTIELELSNRVQRIKAANFSGSARDNSLFEHQPPKVFFQVKVDLNLALGTLIKNPMFEEAEAEFPHLASFATSITLRNALQDEIISGASKDQEALLITLRRPIIFVLPSAFDKAILVWLNYKNAYEYWMEQRLALNKEIQMATQQVLTKIPPLTETNLGILFLQMTIDDLGICLPMNPSTQKGFSVTREDSTFCGAMVLTLESAQISACSYGSFVCKGKFTGFCLRLAEDFEVSWDDWKPEKSYEFVMNALVVPNGTFEMCSRTINLRTINEEQKKAPTSTASQNQSGNAKWILNILWQMKGIDIHLDTNIGKRLNVLWNTLTALAGETQLDDVNLNKVQDIPTRVEHASRKQSAILQDDLPDFVFDLTLDSKTRARLIENEMNEQAKVVQDLKILRASKNTIQEEERKLQGLQAALFNDFRQDIIKRFRYHSKKKIPDSDYGHSRSTSIAGFKLDGSYNSPLGIKESKEIEPHRVLEPPSQNFKITPNHMRTHSFDVSQLQFIVPDDLISNSSRPNLSSPIEEEPVTSLAVPVTPTQTKIDSQQKTGMVDEAFDDIKIIDFDDEDFDYEDIPDTIEHKEIDYSRGQTSKFAKAGKQIVEPAIDFELDVRAEINSGKCVLHPKEAKVEPSTEAESIMFFKNKGRSHISSPREKRRAAVKRPDYLTHRASRMTILPNNKTVFFIPGVEVKLHYNSRTLSAADDDSPSTKGKGKKFLGVKKANLYAWFSIQELPEEMLISTSLLDFLEQAIEPIPIEPLKKASFKINAVHSQMSQSLGSFGSSFASSNVQPYTSFPVDVVVYIRVQPSMVRFSCLPVSRVECLLRIPSLDIVFSTKKVDNHFADSVLSKDRLSILSLDGAQSGGLSVSVCMNDFSLYIFHPYGGGQRKPSGINMDNQSLKASPSSKKTQVMIETRKDSLSLNVEFIKVNISRSRVGVHHKELGVVEHLGQKHQQTASNVVQFSLVCDIGSASFKYDMRRLMEILALPKAWYRRSLARRLFLGEEMAVFDSESSSDDDGDDDMGYDISQFSSESSLNVNETIDEYHTKDFQVSQASIEKLFSDFQHPDVNEMPSQHPLKSIPSAPQKSISSWETLVLVTVNLPQLDVMVNMSNAMGNTVWTTKGLQCQGKLKIDSAGYRNVNLCAGLSSSKLEAKGGIIGGLVEIQNLNANTFVKEVPGKEPEHKTESNLHALETRLDYMGSTILIGRISDLFVQLSDEWQLRLPGDSHLPTASSVLLLIHGKLVWDKLHLMISRSTTPDLLKMVHKLEEFFSQQMMSGKRVLSTFGAVPSSSKSKQKNKEGSSGISWLSELNLHRNWQSVLEKLSLFKLSIFPSVLSEKGTVVGGSMNLVGKNITLACFHGMNFRSKFWALFTMDEPYIIFATEAADIETDENKKRTQIIQNLTFQLRHNSMDMSGKRRMAMVYKLSRGHYMPPPFTSVQEWFHYAFANNDIKDLDKFPSSSKSPSESTTQETIKKQSTRRMAEYSHETEVIFILPSFQMNLKTIQLQEDKLPTEDDKRPEVECSFVTQFDDHIFVAMDAEAVLFLHDLITNYVKEKDKLDKMSKSPEMEKQKQAEGNPIALKKDIREFDCKTWHLEPTVRLLSWAGKEIDPVGVDYILQKLGFQHARLTIPKWMQRGFMDPLDKILSVLVNRLLTALQESNS